MEAAQLNSNHSKFLINKSILLHKLLGQGFDKLFYAGNYQIQVVCPVSGINYDNLEDSMRLRTWAIQITQNFSCYPWCSHWVGFEKTNPNILVDSSSYLGALMITKLSWWSMSAPGQDRHLGVLVFAELSRLLLTSLSTHDPKPISVIHERSWSLDHHLCYLSHF